eukprot:IDg2598t1
MMKLIARSVHRRLRGVLAHCFSFRAERLSPDTLKQTHSAHTVNLLPTVKTADTANTADTDSIQARQALLQRAHSTLSPLLSRAPLLKSVILPRDCSYLSQGPALSLGVFLKSVSSSLPLSWASQRHRPSQRYCPKGLFSLIVLHHPNSPNITAEACS